MMHLTQTKTLAQNTTMPDLEQFMTTKEAAEKLGFHVASVQNMVKKKTLEGIRFGKVWLVSKKSVRDYLKKTDEMSKNDPRRKSLK
jgi:excisionase family DNA binding protein